MHACTHTHVHAHTHTTTYTHIPCHTTYTELPYLYHNNTRLLPSSPSPSLQELIVISTSLYSAGKEWKRICSSASKQIVPRRVASFTASINELNREFTDYLAAVVHRSGGNINDMYEEITKFAFQGDNELTVCWCLLIVSFSLSPISLPLPPSLVPPPSLYQE